MSELSPAAQAVIDAYWATPSVPITTRIHQAAVAAAIRSAVDKVVPEENVDKADYNCLHAKWSANGAQEVREKLLTIATELETQP